MAQAGPASTPSGRFPALPKYEIQEELGHGGMATVYRAHDKRLGRDVAIKVLHPHLRDSREIAHRFGVEAKAVARLRHPNIVEVFDVSEIGDGERYLVVELVRGTTLRKLLEDRGALPPEIAAAIALEILSGLSHAHGEGVIHRDVKPENVLLEHPHLYKKATGESLPPRSNPNDKNVRVKLTDFGIAKMLDAQGVTSTGQVLGSPAHMAPEQIDGGEVDQRSDVFGLGVLLYESMVGHLPFEGSNPAQVLRRVLDGTYTPAERDRPVVGKDWSKILDRALALDPSGRFTDADDMARAMRALMKTLGLDDPRTELEDYFRDPATYETQLEAKLVARLKELGAAAKKKGDVQGAANAYNRALAYAPNDPELRGVVAALMRAEERKQLARRAARPAGLMLALGLGAFAVTRIFTGSGPGATTIQSARPVTSTAPPTSAIASVVASSSAAPRPTNTARIVAIPALSQSVRKELHRRAVTVTSMQPPAGVRAALDDASLGSEVTPGVPFVSLPDNGPHKLTFSCLGDMCEEMTRKIEPGDTDETFSIALKIRDAILTVDGPQSGTYRITQHPEIAMQSGIGVHVPMSRGSEAVTVKEFTSGKSIPVMLHAGKEDRVDFTQLSGGGAP